MCSIVVLKLEFCFVLVVSEELLFCLFCLLLYFAVNIIPQRTDLQHSGDSRDSAHKRHSADGHSPRRHKSPRHSSSTSFQNGSGHVSAHQQIKCLHDLSSLQCKVCYSKFGSVCFLLFVGGTESVDVHPFCCMTTPFVRRCNILWGHFVSRVVLLEDSQF